MPKQTSALHLRGKALEEMFFRKSDQVLIAKKRQLEKAERSLVTVAKVTGISNESVLRKLIDMNVELEVLATLSIIPLVVVAWADGKIEPEERAAVLKAAEGFGISKTQLGYGLIEQWLGRKPPEGLLESWIYYMRGLCPLLGGEERAALKLDVMQKARLIAEAAGGSALRKSKISLREHDVLAQLEGAFEL